MKTIGKYIILALASVLMVSASAMATEPVKTTGVTTTKKVTGPVNNQYTLTLESFVEALVEQTTENTPVDVVLVLDVSGSMNGTIGGRTKMSLLKTAVKDFIQVIYDNAIYEDWDKTTHTHERGQYLQNNISIVKFASAGGVIGYYDNNEDAYQDEDGGDHTRRYGDANLNYTEVVRRLSLVTEKKEDLDLAVDGLNEGGATASHYGLKLASNILEHDPNTGHNKVVVMFTDGEPNISANAQFEYTVAAEAVNNAYTIKNTYGATIYTVGVFGSMTSQARNRVDNYMHHVSSNYPKGQAEVTYDWWGNANGINYSGTRPTGSDFYKSSTGSNLSEIFKSIAHGAAGAAVSLGTDVKVIDEVTSSFALPEGANENNIKVYLVDCKSENTDGSLNFDEPSSSNQVWPNNETYKPTLSARDANGITHLEVKGFDFSENYCGRYYDPNDDTKYTIGGKKLVIEIPIEIDQNAVGGLGVYTNTDQSGLYKPLKDENGDYIRDEDGNIQYELISSFAPKPALDVPVNIQIKKAGLDEGESAVFNISRCAIMTETDESGNTRPKRDADGNYILSDEGYQPYTTMTVTGNGKTAVDELPVAKIAGLNPGYVYKIVESGWAWAYSNQESDISTGGASQTTQDIDVNPFIFDNKKIDIDIKKAEAVGHNVFENPKHHVTSKVQTSDNR